MPKQIALKNSTGIKVKVVYQPAPDYEKRLAEIFSLLLRPIAEEHANKKIKPPYDSSGADSISGGDKEGNNHGP